MYTGKHELADLLRRVSALEAAAFGRPQGPAEPAVRARRSPDGAPTREQRVRRLLDVTASWGDVRGQSMRSLLRRLRAEGGRGAAEDLYQAVRLTWLRLGGEGVVVDPELAHLAAPDAPEGAPPPADMPEWLRDALGGR